MNISIVYMKSHALTLTKRLKQIEKQKNFIKNSVCAAFD